MTIVSEEMRSQISISADNVLSEALTRLAACRDSGEVVAACRKGVLLLEEMPLDGYADTRIELGWSIAKALYHDFAHIELCARALLAAFPSGAVVRDRSWERKWLTAIGVIERMRGNIAESLRAELAGLSLAQEIGDIAGQAAVLGNLTSRGVITARFDEALRLSAIAIDAATKGTFLNCLALTRLNRGTVFLYLGRFEECLENAQQALIAMGPVTDPVDLRRMVLAKVLASEALIGLGRYEEARVAIEAARVWSRTSEGWTANIEVERVSALLEVARGEVQGGVAALRQLRSSAAAADPSVYVDLLQSEYRAHVMSSDEEAAVETLKELRDWFIYQAEQAIRLAAEPSQVAPFLDLSVRMSEIDEYLETRRLLARVERPANASWEFLVALAATSGGQEPSSLEHGLRVGRLSSLVGAVLDLDSETRDKLEAAGLVHDVGKVGVPGEILGRADSLCEAELVLYEAHSDLGAQLIEQAAVPNKRFIANVARYHHVAFDGMGRRRSGVQGKDIPLEARIVSVCDAFDVLIAGRSGRLPESPEQALQKIYACSGRDFDPQIVDALVEVVRELSHDRKRLIADLSVRANEIAFFASRRALQRVSTEGLY